MKPFTQSVPWEKEHVCEATGDMPVAASASHNHAALRPRQWPRIAMSQMPIPLCGSCKRVGEQKNDENRKGD